MYGRETRDDHVINRVKGVRPLGTAFSSLPCASINQLFSLELILSPKPVRIPSRHHNTSMHLFGSSSRLHSLLIHHDVFRLSHSMGIKGLTALISEHAPKAIRVSCTALPFSTSLTRRDPQYTGARHQEPLRPQSRNRRVYVHLPISHCRAPARRPTADE